MTVKIVLVCQCQRSYFAIWMYILPYSLNNEESTRVSVCLIQNLLKVIQYNPAPMKYE